MLLEPSRQKKMRATMNEQNTVNEKERTTKRQRTILAESRLRMCSLGEKIAFNTGRPLSIR